VQDPKCVKVRATFDAKTTHPEAQQRQGWQAILNDFTERVKRAGQESRRNINRITAESKQP
jgi:hypothetical protein